MYFEVERMNPVSIILSRSMPRVKIGDDDSYNICSTQQNIYPQQHNLNCDVNIFPYFPLKQKPAEVSLLYYSILQEENQDGIYICAFVYSTWLYYMPVLQSFGYILSNLHYLKYHHIKQLLHSKLFGSSMGPLYGGHMKLPSNIIERNVLYQIEDVGPAEKGGKQQVQTGFERPTLRPVREHSNHQTIGGLMEVIWEYITHFMVCLWFSNCRGPIEEIGEQGRLEHRGLTESGKSSMVLYFFLSSIYLLLVL